jgi:uncharacterized protein
MKNNIVGWFEIPVINMERALKFYETILKIKLTPTKILEYEMALFPEIEGGLGTPGALMMHQSFIPSDKGVLIYFTPPSGNLANELSRVEAAGGTVLQQKALITEEIGYWGVFLDTEGNRIGIHSRK